jgi:hypothetical protein
MSGTVLYTGIVLLVNFHINKSTYMHYIWGYLTVLNAIVNFFGFDYTISSLEGNYELYNTFGIVFTNPLTYLSCFFVVSLLYTFDKMYKAIQCYMKTGELLQKRYHDLDQGSQGET